MARLRAHAFDWMAWLLFASVPAVIFWQSATSLAEQGASEGGALENAALYPRVIATAMSVAVAVQGARLLLGRVQHLSPFEAEPGTRLALVLTAVFVGYLALLPYAGFHILTPVLLTVTMRAFGLTWLSAAVGSIALWLATSFVFEGMLNVVLPVGVFAISVFG